MSEEKALTPAPEGGVQPVEPQPDQLVKKFEDGTEIYAGIDANVKAKYTVLHDMSERAARAHTDVARYTHAVPAEEATKQEQEKTKQLQHAEQEKTKRAKSENRHVSGRHGLACFGGLACIGAIAYQPTVAWPIVAVAAVFVAVFKAPEIVDKLRGGKDAKPPEEE